MDKATPPSWVRRAQSITSIVFEIAHERLGEAAGTYLAFPRDITKLVSYTFEIPIIPRLDLSLEDAANYLCLYFNRETEEQSRSLFGLLHVGPPGTVIFIEQRLSPEMRNYVIAHELGHYLYDVFLTRRLWLESLPEQKATIMQAFSWQAFDPFLQLQVFVKGLPARPRTITARGKYMLPATRERERFADAAAFELLAPWEQAANTFAYYSRAEMLERLRTQYGLPLPFNRWYYDMLRTQLSPRTDVFDQIFGSLLPRNISEDTQQN